MTQPAMLSPSVRDQLLAQTSNPVAITVDKTQILWFADGIGDDNPLWNDEKIARNSRYRGLVAPPTFTRLLLFMASPPGQAHSLLRANVRVDAGTEWEYFHPIRAGDRITVASRTADAFEKPGRTGPLAFVVNETDFFNQHDQLAVRMKTTVIYMNPSSSGASTNETARHAAPSHADDRPSQAGAEKPLWDEIKEGDRLPSAVWQTSTRDIVKYASAGRDFYEIHYDHRFARRAGLPGVIMHGGLKAARLGKLITDWIGDAGELRKLGCQHRAMDFPGERQVCDGKVVRKYQKDRQRLIDLQLAYRNASGTATAPAAAAVSLFH